MCVCKLVGVLKLWVLLRLLSYMCCMSRKLILVEQQNYSICLINEAVS
jgi:hypothetical protein